MPIAYRIPVAPVSQVFKASLGGIIYQINLYWSTANGVWIIDLADNSGNPILSGIPVVAGTDLLLPYPYLNLGGALVAINAGDVTKAPTFADLGTASNLYFVTP